MRHSTQQFFRASKNNNANNSAHISGYKVERSVTVLSSSLYFFGKVCLNNKNVCPYRRLQRLAMQQSSDCGT